MPPISKSSAARPAENEFQFLCALAGAQLNPEQVERIAKWNLSAVDWSELLRLAGYHGVLPLVARNLIEHAQAPPEEIEHSLRSAYEANLKRSLWFTSELGRVLRHFDQVKLTAVPYKGPVLAQTVYHDLALRSFSDLDLLIAASDFHRAKRALGELGYKPSEEMTIPVELFWLGNGNGNTNGNERIFDGSAGKYLLELQWALLPYFFGVDLPVEDLTTRAGRIVIGGCEMLSLSPEDLVLVLCLHAAKHLWLRLMWVVDIAEALRINTIDYSVVASRARELGILRILGVSFWLAKNVLRMEIPPSAEEIAALDPNVCVLGGEFAERIARGATYNFESTEYYRYFLKLRERRSDRWRYLWRLIWTPSVGDVAAVPLPEALYPLYRIVRIGRLIKKLF